MSLLSLFGFGNNKIKEALSKGAVVIDVRTAYEFDLGHVPNSINIPVDRISSNIERIKDIKKPVIFWNQLRFQGIESTGILMNLAAE